MTQSRCTPNCEVCADWNTFWNTCVRYLHTTHKPSAESNGMVTRYEWQRMRRCHDGRQVWRWSMCHHDTRRFLHNHIVKFGVCENELMIFLDAWHAYHVGYVSYITRPDAATCPVSGDRHRYGPYRFALDTHIISDVRYACLAKLVCRGLTHSEKHELLRVVSFTMKIICWFPWKKC